MEGDMLVGDTAILQPYFQMLAQMMGREMGEEIGGIIILGMELREDMMRLFRQRNIAYAGFFPITYAKIRHPAGAICTLWSKMVHFCPFWFTFVQDGTLSSVSYMILAYVIYDTCQCHI